ncbi:MAG: transposase, partial [Lysobacterales bacterium]
RNLHFASLDLGDSGGLGPDFSREAVQLATAPGSTLRGVARDLGLNENLLSRWNKELLANGDSAFLGQSFPRLRNAFDVNIKTGG